MATITDNPAMIKQDWLSDLDALIGDIRSWCLGKGLATADSTKLITESKVGEYSVSVLQLRTTNGQNVFVEPIARFVVDAQGLVDIYSWPSLRRIVLVRQLDNWAIRTDSGVPLPMSWSEKSFFEIIDALTSEL